MELKLSEHFTYKKIFRFALPSIVMILYVLPCVAMMILTSVYSIVDGFFVSNYAGKNAFAAVNLIMPVLMGVSSLGFMIGTGGSALVAFYLGLKNPKKANEVFSMLIELILLGASIIAFLGFIFMPQIVSLLASEQFPEFPRHCRETKTRTSDLDPCRTHQCYTRLYTGRDLKVWNYRCCSCNLCQRICRRLYPTDLFSA